MYRCSSHIHVHVYTYILYMWYVFLCYLCVVAYTCTLVVLVDSDLIIVGSTCTYMYVVNSTFCIVCVNVPLHGQCYYKFHYLRKEAVIYM